MILQVALLFTTVDFHWLGYLLYILSGSQSLISADLIYW